MQRRCAAPVCKWTRDRVTGRRAVTRAEILQLNSIDADVTSKRFAANWSEMENQCEACGENRGDSRMRMADFHICILADYGEPTSLNNWVSRHAAQHINSVIPF